MVLRGAGTRRVMNHCESYEAHPLILLRIESLNRIWTNNWGRACSGRRHCHGSGRRRLGDDGGGGGSIDRAWRQKSDAEEFYMRWNWYRILGYDFFQGVRVRSFLDPFGWRTDTYHTPKSTKYDFQTTISSACGNHLMLCYILKKNKLIRYNFGESSFDTTTNDFITL